MESLYRLQIVRADGSRVRWRPGGLEELDFIAACVDCICAKGVGFLKTEATVKRAIQEGIEETLNSLKERVDP